MRPSIDEFPLQEEEEDNLNFDYEFPNEVPEAEFMAICCEHTTRPFSSHSFYSLLGMTCSLAQGVNFWPVGSNPFVLTVNCLGDCGRITEKGPWIFRNNGVIIEPYDGFTKLDEVVLDRLPLWIQVHNVLPGYRTKRCRNIYVKELVK